MKSKMKPMMKPKQMNMTGPKCMKMSKSMKMDKMPMGGGSKPKKQKGK